MRILLLCKRRYTNKDLVDDHFGRLFHLPLHWSRHCPVEVMCLDYKGRPSQTQHLDNLTISSQPLGLNPVDICRTAGEIIRAAKIFRPDVVIASSDIFYGIAGLFLARRTGARFVFDLYDDYRAFRINQYTGLTATFGAVCKRADLLLCASDPIRILTTPYNTNAVVIGNGYDPTVFYPNSSDPARQARRARLGIASDELLLIYPGATAARVDLPLVATALARLNAEGQRTWTLLIGPDSEQQANRSPWFITLPQLPQTEVADWLRAADIGIAPYAAMAQTLAFAPCKLAEFLACGLPVVATDISNLAEFHHHGVYTYQAGNIDAFVTAVKKAVSAGRSGIPLQEFLWENLAGKSLAAIRELVI